MTAEQVAALLAAFTRGSKKPADEKSSDRSEIMALQKIRVDTFDGRDKAKLQTWKYRLEEAFQLYDISEANQLRMAQNFLRGPAERWHMRLKVEGKIAKSLAEFFQTLEEHFFPTASMDDLREKIYDVKCHSERSISDYITRFETLKLQIPEFTEAHFIWLFKRGLRELEELNMNLSSVRTLEEAYTMARGREIARKQQARPDSKRSRGESDRDTTARTARGDRDGKRRKFGNSEWKRDKKKRFGSSRRDGPHTDSGKGRKHDGQRPQHFKDKFRSQRADTGQSGQKPPFTSPKRDQGAADTRASK